MIKRELICGQENNPGRVEQENNTEKAARDELHSAGRIHEYPRELKTQQNLHYWFQW